MTTYNIRFKHTAVSLYDVFAHICRTDVKAATKRLHNLLRSGSSDLSTIRSILQTKSAYEIFTHADNFRPTPGITSSSQFDAVLKEFTSIFNHSVKYSKMLAITQQASLLSFTTDTYPLMN